MKEHRPAYQRYARDELADAIGLTLEEMGALTRLQDLCWLEGSVPGDLGGLARICNVSRKRMAQIWAAIAYRFEPLSTEPQRVVYPPLEAYRRELDAYHASQSESGRRGAEKRWGRRSAPNGDPNSNPIGEAIATPMANGMANHMANDSSASATASASASGEAAAAAALPGRPDNDSPVCERIPERYRETYRALRRFQRNPDRFDADILDAATGAPGRKAYTWDTVGHALQDIAGKDVDYTRGRLFGYCKGVEERNGDVPGRQPAGARS